MVTNTKLFIPDDNPYDQADRGLFLTRNLLISAEQVADCYCRIQQATLMNFQGAPNYTIVGYKVGYWLEQPVSDADYDAMTLYKDPRGNVETFYFTMQPQEMSLIEIENYCINDFVKVNRMALPAKWPTLGQLYTSYNAVKNEYHMHGVTAFAVNNVMHRAEYVSVSGKPLQLASQKLRYRGYEMKGTLDVHPLEPYVYKENQFLYVDNVQFVDRAQIVTDAQRHFISDDGQRAVRELLHF